MHTFTQRFNTIHLNNINLCIYANIYTYLHTYTQHGKGKFVYRSGNVYEGDWSNDVPHGKGNFIEGNIIYDIEHDNGTVRVSVWVWSGVVVGVRLEVVVGVGVGVGCENNFMEGHVVVHNSAHTDNSTLCVHV